MGKLGEEVSVKIKSAIKAKLTELGVHIDNELPDYVMVLVANKKTQIQMENDLRLFLGDSTRVFTTWLHNVLQKLEQVTISTKGKHIKVEEASDDDDAVSLHTDTETKNLPLRGGHAAFTDKTQLEPEKIIKQDEIRSDSPRKPDNRVKDLPIKPRERIQIVWGSNSNDENTSGGERSRSRSPDRRRSRSRDSRKRRGRSRDKYNRQRRSRSRSNKYIDAREVLKRRAIDNGRGSTPHRENPFKENVKKEKLSSVLKAVIKTKEKVPTVPSLVQVKPRPMRNPGLQPNCNLILKAVADAEKSVATSKKPDPISEIDERQRRSRYEYEVKGNISVTLLNDRVAAAKIGVPQGDTVMEKDIEPKEELMDTGEIEEYVPTAKSLPPTIPTPFTGIQDSKLDQAGQRFIITLDSTASDNEIDSEMPLKMGQKNEMEFNMGKRFDRNRLGPKMETSFIDEDEILLTPIENVTSQTKCKFWPSCEAGDSCPYFHPTTLCRMFPTCVYGEKCLYIHPACKYADNCRNVKCPYAHTTVSPTGNTAVKSVSMLCAFFPKCTKPFCPYLHIKKPCRFGTTCSKLGCEFDHSNGRNPYKWVANQ